MSNLVKEFNNYRTRMNDVILSKDNLVIKRLRKAAEYWKKLKKN